MHKKQKSNNKSHQGKTNKCFHYALTFTLNCEEIGKHPERITHIKPFINKYNCEGIKYLSEKDNWKKNQKNYLTIAVNVLYAKNNIYI